MLSFARRKVLSRNFHASILERVFERVLPALRASLRRFYTSGKEITVRDALNSALDEEMSADPKVFLMGEEVGEYQGAHKISKGLLDKYGPKRVIDTPITEAGFTGVGVGAAYYGLRPIVEFMTFNFSMQKCSKSFTYLLRCSRQLIISSTLLQSQTTCQQVKYLCLLFSEDQMVQLLELLPKTLRYGESFHVSAEALDSSFCLPIGKAKIERDGKDVTITAFSKMVGYSMQAADILAEKGVCAEVINLRSIRPLDRATINASVRKTNRLVTVEEGFPQHGVSAEICTSVIEESFEYLDAPVERIAGADVPMPYAPNIERLAVPQVEDIVRAAMRACYRSVRLSAAA